MAEVLGVVASCISVVQLLGCIQQLRKFCKSVHDVPEELKATLDEMEVFRQVVSQIGNADGNISLVSGSSMLQASLDRCEAAASALEALTARIIAPLNRRSNLRSKHLLKAVLKKEEMKEMKEKMDSARNMLHLAVTCYNTYDLSRSWKSESCAKESQVDAPREFAYATRYVMLVETGDALALPCIKGFH
ncbi:uncharacterized protein BP5553_06714 [Venustampulla echinocandica]|uniref:NACHT-NTPase and P-loop NTPases N-terminal domain-containing protein n=1 Tax=Venustampulla echinocandica TaxID=2656787 RepID=A0A370TKQ0_9HELO|nr:uncharacterized protein BP5553_06714 [Venustampulla echinocandica]RDL36102.1 hypothetical protein BP5553_06714 [Venustampulla echinocandica]